VLRTQSPLLLLLALLVYTGASHGQSADEMRALLDRGQAAAAYELGLKAPERLGDPAFDLAFGVAAINAGKPAAGVLALERVLLQNPGNEVARVELARGYFLLGDDHRAREEFELALARDPPGAVARVIREYLEALRERAGRGRATLGMYVEGGLGYDSNPRAGVDNPLITLPVVGEVTVAEQGVRAGDRTRQWGAGFRATLPLAARTVLFAAGQADVARYPTQDDFDQALYAGSAGLQGRWGAAAWRGGLSRAYQTLDRVAYRHTEGAFADLGVPVNERDAASIGIQLGRNAFSGFNVVRDSEFATVTAGWRHSFAGLARAQIEAAANLGRERNVNDDRQDLSRDMFGARLGVSLIVVGDWTLAAGGAWQRSRYHDPDALLQTVRDDRYLAGELALSWNAFRGLVIRAEVTEAKNDSNLALYEYRRRTTILRGRYEFR